MPFPWELTHVWHRDSVPASLEGAAHFIPLVLLSAAGNLRSGCQWVSVSTPGGEPRRSCLAMGGLVQEGSGRLVSLQFQIHPIGKVVRQSLRQWEGEDAASAEQRNRKL